VLGWRNSPPRRSLFDEVRDAQRSAVRVPRHGRADAEGAGVLVSDDPGVAEVDRLEDVGLEHLGCLASSQEAFDPDQDVDDAGLGPRCARLGGGAAWRGERGRGAR
jgi:hypothetical protein